MNPIIDTFVAPVCLQQIEILVQDEHFLLIEKPSGLLSLSGKNPLNRDSVHFRLIQDFPTARLVHRLDFGTSGIMLVALNAPATAKLAKQFELQSVSKTYVSLVDGYVVNDSGQINAPIAKDSSLFPRVKICHQLGKPAQTNYQVIERLQNSKSTHLRYFPKTGRTHQLRIHSQHIGHPILGCDLYGSKTSHHATSRLMLHAEKIGFDHPVSGKRIVTESVCRF